MNLGLNFRSQLTLGLNFRSKLNLGLTARSKLNLGMDFRSKLKLGLNFTSKLNLGLNFTSKLNLGLNFRSKLNLGSKICTWSIWKIAEYGQISTENFTLSYFCSYNSTINLTNFWTVSEFAFQLFFVFFRLITSNISI